MDRWVPQISLQAAAGKQMTRTMVELAMAFAECGKFQGIFDSSFWEWQEVKRFSIGIVDTQTSTA